MKNISQFLFKVLFLFVFGFVSFQLGISSALNSDKSFIDTTVANEAWKRIKNHYLRIDDITPEKTKYGLAKGLTKSLGDPHTIFFDPEEAETFQTNLDGDLVGIGAELSIKDGQVQVITPLPNSPAQKAGLRARDIIIKIDDEVLTANPDLGQVVNKIRGQEGTDIKLTVLHEDEINPEVITITRAAIHLNAVEYSIQEYNDQQVPLIKVSSFTNLVADEFGNELKKVVDAGYKNLIIDLRFNGGGYLNGAIEMLSYFFKEEVTALVIEQQGESTTRSTKPRDVYFDGNIVVLINEASASASEIVAGALQDYKKATIMGKTSFGKGTVQQLEDLLDGSKIRITIAEWFTPLKNSIEKTGLKPDIEVDIDYELYQDGVDSQLESALKTLVDA